MATLQQIYVNLISGAFIAVTSFGLFGLVIRKGYTNQVAPRSWSRPKAILTNVLKKTYAFSWISWSWRQTYPDLMAGVPGTGTRSDGWAGPMLKVNLDGIIMLKYHKMLLKISVLATVLCLLVVLPINITAKCDPVIFGLGTCQTTHNLTDFETTTIAHIPANIFNGSDVREGDDDGIVEDFNQHWVTDTSGRYLGIALVSWIIYWYICHLLWKEWIENLALRRAFFLEYDHFKERRDELNEVVQLKDVPEDPRQKTRHPWLPHPELRETIPNVSLYSCIYRLPNQIETDLPDTASDLERQLSASIKFFDECIPTPPGFTSSVVALTILPEPAIVSQAWKKWYYCGKKLRQLRYIRHHIQLQLERQQQAEEEERVVDEKATMQNKHRISSNSESGEEKSENEKEQQETTEADPVADVEAQPKSQSQDQDDKKSSQNLSQGLVGSIFGGNNEAAGKTSMKDDESPASLPAAAVELDALSPAPTFDSTTSQNDGFSYAEFDIESLAKEIGFSEESNLGNHFADIGIEQLSVYAREYAQSSSNAYPYGFAAETVVRFASLEKLQAMEKETIEHVRIANEELVDTRRAVDLLCSGTEEVPIVVEEDVAGEGTYDPATSKKDDGPASPGVADDGKPLSSFPGASTISNVRQRVSSSTSKTWNQAQAAASSMSKSHEKTVEKTSLCLGWMGRGARKGSHPIAERAADLAAPITEAIAEEIRDNSDLKKLKILNLQHPTYAVVTLTSRQAAVAARQCLADGSGIDNWVEIEELPVAPLADAPPWDIMFFRSCCRPVTLTISDREKKCRRIAGVSFFLFFCFFYTIPLALVSQLLNPAKLAEVFPDWEAIQNPDGFFYTVFAGISSGFLYTVFFSFCPQLFKAIANFEGNVSSKRTAEDKALQYFWYFMMLTAFTGTALTQMITQIFTTGNAIGTEIKEVLVDVADSIPTQQAPVWMNWLIVRFTYTLPFLYLLQANTFGFSIIRWGWCGRLMRGGGPGGPPPYRIYVDSGTAHMCIVAMAPVCPLIAPLALLYYIVILLMLRWLLVFVYRPWYDAGGNKWPALHEIVVSSTIFGQVLLAAILALRNALLPFAMVIAAIVPTYMFSENCKSKFLRAYNDASLWHTSKLDRSELAAHDAPVMSDHRREEYRRWLVDCHKASYVPICLAGTESLLTVDFATVKPREHIVDQKAKTLREGLEKRRSRRLDLNTVAESKKLLK